MKIIQVFLKGSDSAELSVELIKFQIKQGCLWVTFKEEPDYIGTTVFPLSSISMFRLFDEEDK